MIPWWCHSVAYFYFFPSVFPFGFEPLKQYRVMMYWYSLVNYAIMCLKWALRRSWFSVALFFGLHPPRWTLRSCFVKAAYKWVRLFTFSFYVCDVKTLRYLGTLNCLKYSFLNQYLHVFIIEFYKILFVFTFQKYF
jgi:hypothetical protein